MPASDCRQPKRVFSCALQYVASQLIHSNIEDFKRSSVITATLASLQRLPRSLREHRCTPENTTRGRTSKVATADQCNCRSMQLPINATADQCNCRSMQLPINATADQCNCRSMQLPINATADQARKSAADQCNCRSTADQCNCRSMQLPINATADQCNCRSMQLPINATADQCSSSQISSLET